MGKRRLPPKFKGVKPLRIDHFNCFSPDVDASVAFWNEIAPHLKAGRLHCVRLYETPRNYAEYFGPEAS